MATVNFTTNLALALPTTGDLSGSWGTAVNTGISELVDQALGYQAFSATGGSDTLTIPDAATGVARSIYIQLNGTGGGTVNVPTTKTKMYFVFNNTASAITFKVTGQTGVSIPAAAKIALVSNGTDVIPAVNYFSTAISAAANTGSMIPFYYANQAAFPSAATSHGAIAHSHADNAMYFAHSSAWWRLLDEYTDVTVAQGGTGLSTLTANNVILGNGTSTPLFVAPSTAGNVLTSTGTTWASTAPAAGGVTTFTAGTTGFTPSTATSGAVTLAGTLATANGGTGATSATAAMASLMGFTTTATAAGTTTLTNTSSYYQQFTGTTTQTVRLPVTSTLVTGWTFHIVNNSTGNVSVQSSGANAVITVLPGTTAMCTCIGITLTTAADWESGLTDFSTATGTGSVVLSTSPTLVTPLLGTPSQGVLSSCTVDGTNKVGYLNIPQTGAAKTASYTLVVGDVGKFVVLGTSGLVVIPASVFAVGDAISVVNNTTAAITCTSSAITAYIGGTNTVRTSFSLATRGVCTILFVTTTVVVITGNVS